MKNKILLISILILTIIIIIAQFVPKDSALYALKINKDNSTLNSELSNFAVKDVDAIDKIIIADKQDNTVILEKTGKTWKVNHKFYAREDAIKNLLQAVGKMRVKRPISKTEKELQIRRLATQSKKVVIYQKGKKVKTYYVGGATSDQYGTFVLLEGSSVPFVVEVPGFLGFLTPRFFATEDLWRENYIFKSSPKNINFVQVLNSEDKTQSFTITKDDNDKFHLLNSENQEMDNIDTLQIQRYLSFFTKISYEAMVVNMDESKRDSLKHSQPFHTITLKAGKNNQQVIKTYHVKNDTQYDDDGNMLKYDPDRMYGSFNGGKDLATVQFRTFDRITVDPKFFLKNQ